MIHTQALTIHKPSYTSSPLVCQVILMSVSLACKTLLTELFLPNQIYFCTVYSAMYSLHGIVHFDLDFSGSHDEKLVHYLT